MKRLGWLAAAAFLAVSGGGCGPSADQMQEEARLGAPFQDFFKASRAQMILTYSGFDVGYVDGSIGPDTRVAIRRFQRSRGLNETGYLGDATWKLLMKLEKREGPFDGERLQRGLKRAGFDPGEIDGEIGSMTMAALTRFQRANGLEATGRLDPETWDALQQTMPDQLLAKETPR
jgi:peptidoglycan hydrolase-like protein with peptidoglycan-binding domain